MKFKSIEKIQQGKFISRYDITYETTAGRDKIYEMISRDPNISGPQQLAAGPLNAVALIIFDPSREHLLLNREFRLGAGQFVYNFPAGLLEPGEDLVTAARRELWEETGLELVEVDDILPESFSAPGMTNEKNAHVVGVAAGQLRASDRAEEEIMAAWFSKAQLRRLLREQPFAARTQVFCYQWSRE